MNRRISRSTRGLCFTAALAGLVGLAACDDGTGIDNAVQLQVLMTDAASDYIAEAMVDIGAVELVGGEGGPVVLSEDGTDGMVNLLDLQNAATIMLADAEVEAGRYSQLRLIVEAASVTLADGYEFNGGGNTMDLTVPSGAQTGIKLNLHAASADGTGEGSVEIAPGELVLVLDFDVNQSFVLQGSPDTPAGINSVSFTPTIRVVVQDVAASISGNVSTSVDGLSVEGMVVTATPTDGTTLEPFQSTTGTATVAADGSYTVFFLVPGEYTVSVDAGEGYTANVVDAEAGATITLGEGDAATGMDFVVVAN